VTQFIPLGQRLSIGALSILFFLLCITFLLGAILLIAWSPVLFAGIILILFLLTLPLTWLLAKLFKKAFHTESLRFYLTTTFFLILLTTSVITLPFYYLAIKSESDPLVLPQAVISDGKKTVVFQGMVHVGSENFYKSVIYDLEEALDGGSKIYYEGIMPSTDEANKWFSQKIVGGGELSSHYRELAGVCGVKFQLDYFQLLIHDMQQRPDRHATVDVSTADLKNEYERLLKTDPEFAQAVAEADREKESGTETSDIYADKILAYVKNANDSQKEIVGVICRGVVSVALKTSAKKHTDPLNPVLINFRNQHLVKQILSETNDKIYITYGSGHLPGIIKLLHATDPAWEVKSLKWLRGMAAPEHLEGEL